MLSKKGDFFELPEITFCISYDADDKQLSKHRMEAVSLAQSIEEMSNLLRDADEIINGGEHQNLQLYVTAPAKQGSFIIEFVTTLINTDYAEIVLKALGITTSTGAVGGGLFKVLAQTKGKEIREIHTDDTSDYATIILEDGEKITTGKDISKLIASPRIRNHVKQIISNPLAHRGEPYFKIQQPQNTEITFDEQEILSIKQLKTNATAPKIDRITIQASFSQINFKQQTGWKIILEDNNIVNAYLDDQEFLNTIRANRKSFKKDDKYKMIVEITTKINDLDQESKKYKILQVLPL